MRQRSLSIQFSPGQLPHTETSLTYQKMAEDDRKPAEPSTREDGELPQQVLRGCDLLRMRLHIVLLEPIPLHSDTLFALI